MYLFLKKKKMNDFQGMSHEDLLKLLPKILKPGFELTDEFKRFLESEQNACIVKLPISPSRVVLKRSPRSSSNKKILFGDKKHDDLQKK